MASGLKPRRPQALRTAWHAEILAISCVIVVLVVSLIANPTISAHREAITRLEPVTVRASWSWSWAWGSSGEGAQLDLYPMSPVVAEINWKVGLIQADIRTDPNIPGFLERLDNSGDGFSRTDAPFSEGRDFVLKPFLNHTAETIATHLDVGVDTAAQNGTAIETLQSGFLTILLDGTALQQAQFRISPVCPGCYEVDVERSYDGVKDLTNSTLTFLWNGSAPIRVSPLVSYGVYAVSADYVEHLQVTESCIVEKHLLNYLGISEPKLSECELEGWTPLPPVLSPGRTNPFGT